MIGAHIRAWREHRRWPIPDLASRAHVTEAMIEAIEGDTVDPSASTVEALAAGLGVPAPWLYGDPRALIALASDPDESHEGAAAIDPVTAQILGAAHRERALFALLAQLIRAGDPKLLRAAEVNLRSLIKQIPRTTVPWESRPSGHFEPPAD